MLTKISSEICSTIVAFRKDERGVTAIEYAIIGIIISGMILAVFVTDNDLKNALSDAMGVITSNIESAENAGGG
tara:strand:- start:197 stop:418 length:222 start_codon:yes stop_codon:yes gene_type:complete